MKWSESRLNKVCSVPTYALNVIKAINAINQ